MTANTYWPGEKVPSSGVYRVVHTNNHTAAHDVTIARQSEFPLCNECGSRVYFILTKPGENIALNTYSAIKPSESVGPCGGAEVGLACRSHGRQALDDTAKDGWRPTQVGNSRL